MKLDIPKKANLVALLTCHNRREKTLACLNSLEKSTSRLKLSSTIVLVDDGSSDGTSEAVKKAFPSATIIQEDGNRFWCGGMRVAWSKAAMGNPDYYVLLNDDTMLYPYALESLLEIVEVETQPTIAVGAIVDPISQLETYGGYTQRGQSLIGITGRREICDTFNANCVLIPREVYQRIGILHKAYTHSMGDLDYGFHARRNGIKIYQTPQAVGECPKNSIAGTWLDPALSRKDRFKRMMQAKGLPWREWLAYNFRNYRWTWLKRFASPYLRVLLGK